MLFFDYKKMQQSNKNKQLRNNRLTALRQKLKNVPIIHQKTDRVNQLIAQNKNAQKPMYASSTSSVDLTESVGKIKSENRKAFEAKFRIGKKIGQGAHGFVKQCFYKQTEKMFALKTIPSDREFYYYLKRNFVNIMQLNHPNVIKYKAFYFDMIKQTCILVMQFIPFPNLSEIQIQNEEELKRIIYEVIQGLQYIHKKHICHRDIKPENILYDKQNKRAILIDFGVSCQFYQRGIHKQMLTLTGTPYYRAPQMFTGGGYDQRVDLWALGVTIYKLITKVTPFQSLYHSDTIKNIQKGEFVFQEEIWKQYSHLVKDLVIHLLKPKQSRLTITQAKNHFWFSEIRAQIGEQQMTKSAGFNSFFLLQRSITDSHNRGSYIRPRNPTLSPVAALLSSPKMFSLQNFQKQQENMRWITLEASHQMDLIQSEDQDSTLSSPTIKISKAKNEKNEAIQQFKR